MEFYRDDFVYKNENRNEIKKKYISLKIAIIAFVITFGPSIGRSIAHTIQKSDKEYELSERDNLYDIVIKKLREMGISNSIMAAKFVSNLINDGHLTIPSTIDNGYNIVDEYDYDTIIGRPTSKSNSELITKIINKTFDNVDAYTISVNLNNTEENGKNVYTTTHMCLICDRDLKVNYLYWQELDRYIKISDIKSFVNKYIAGNIDYLNGLASGKFDIFELIKIIGNNNNEFYDINFEINKKYADDLYKNSNQDLYELDKLTIRNKLDIQIKEKTNKIPE